LIDIAFLAFDLLSFIQAFLLLFSIFDAIGTVPVFLALTEDFPNERARIIRKSVIIATLILIVFAYLGLFIFQILGITLNDFKVAGGVILFLIALDYLRGRVSETKSVEPSEIAVFPLATPLLAGPGAISTVMIFANPPFGPFMTLLVIILNSFLAWLILSRGVAVQKILGREGTKIVTRIMGLLIAAIGVAFVREGIMAMIGG
jgi:multiple antibiotic resistance protein